MEASPAPHPKGDHLGGRLSPEGELRYALEIKRRAGGCSPPVPSLGMLSTAWCWWLWIYGYMDLWIYGYEWVLTF